MAPSLRLRFHLAGSLWAQSADLPQADSAMVGYLETQTTYPQFFRLPSGDLHVSWVWRETVGVATNHDLCDARSRDGGVTWEKSDGVRYALPINSATAELAQAIPQNSELTNQTSMASDHRGRRYIATYWRSSGSTVPQYRLVYRDVERGSKVSMFRTENLAHNRWTVSDLTSTPLDSWEPSFDTDLWNASRILERKLPSPPSSIVRPVAPLGARERAEAGFDPMGRFNEQPSPSSLPIPRNSASSP